MQCANTPVKKCEMKMRTRTYLDLRHIRTFEDRFDYLQLRGQVGESTFGFDRYINQQFYSSREWKQIRDVVIARDEGCDLGVEGFEIHDKIIIHHMNPITLEELEHGEQSILEPNFLITTTQTTHNAIHYGDRSLLRVPIAPRRAGDTRMW